MTISICLHGPESTGKSTLAPRLAGHFGCLYVPEYGRTYCETYGIELEMQDLLSIAQTHDAMTKAALARGDSHLILDTDPLMTAAWADMLFATRDPWFDQWQGTADLYLMMDIDMPFVADETRFFGDPVLRQKFYDVSKAELDRRGVRYAVISGPADERFARALDAIREAGLGR